MLTVTSRRIDRDDPQITVLTVSPAAVDLTAGSRCVTFTVHARDQVFGEVAPRLQIYNAPHGRAVAIYGWADFPPEDVLSLQR